MDNKNEYKEIICVHIVEICYITAMLSLTILFAVIGGMITNNLYWFIGCLIGPVGLGLYSSTIGKIDEKVAAKLIKIKEEKLEKEKTINGFYTDMAFAYLQDNSIYTEFYNEIKIDRYEKNMKL